MIEGLRSAVPRALGRGLKALLAPRRRRLHSDWSILEMLGPLRAPHVVLDVGANRGQFSRHWLAWCPLAEVHAFEPIAEECDRLRQAAGADTNVVINNVAVGSSPGDLVFNIWDGASECSSLLQHDPPAWENVYVHRGGIDQRTVPVITLDMYCAEHGLSDIFLAKIDVQGYELEVLKGAKETLPRIAHIFLESGIRPLYRGAPGFGQVCDFLLRKGFHLAAMRCWHAGDHVLVEADLLFRRDDLIPRSTRAGARTYERVG